MMNKYVFTHIVFRKIFGYRRSESVKDVIYGLGRVKF